MHGIPKPIQPWVERAHTHRQTLLWFGIGLVLVVALTLYLRHSANQREIASFAKLEAIAKGYEELRDEPKEKDGNQEWVKIKQDLTQFITNQAHGGAKSLAHFYLGEAHYYLGEYEAAIVAYRQHLNGTPRSSPYRVLVYHSLGYAYEGAGKHKEGAEYFLQAAQMNEAPLRDSSLANAARNFELAKMPEQARLYYQEIVDQYPESTWLQLARAKLAQLPPGR